MSKNSKSQLKIDSGTVEVKSKVSKANYLSPHFHVLKYRIINSLWYFEHCSCYSWTVLNCKIIYDICYNVTYDCVRSNLGIVNIYFSLIHIQRWRETVDVVSSHHFRYLSSESWMLPFISEYLFSQLPFKNLNIKIFKTIILLVLCGYEAWGTNSDWGCWGKGRWENMWP
jgi:hypothetical protein